jgi:preprotein translocase SecE subunit
VRSYYRPQFADRLAGLEEQGWFSLAPYKKTQGQRVRRGTMLAILAIAGTGIYTLIDHRTLEFGNPHWVFNIPFSGGASVLLLRDVRFTVPIILAVLSLWFAYRMVNFPVFADFLIATEAELNKVSWASRKRLVQDTIVVLTTVVLVTTFIFVADIVWSTGLKWVGVLQIPEQKSKAEREIEY